MKWFTLSIFAGIALAIHLLSLTKLIKTGVSIGKANFWAFAIATTCLAIYQLLQNEGFKLDSQDYPYIILAGISVFFVIHFALTAINIAPNPGYVNALESLSAIIIAIASVFLFKSTLTFSKIIGITLCLAGAFLIGI